MRAALGCRGRFLLHRNTDRMFRSRGPLARSVAQVCECVTVRVFMCVSLSCVHARGTHSRMHARASAWMHTHVCSLAHAHLHAHTRACTHTCMHVCMNMHALSLSRAHTRTLSLYLACSLSLCPSLSLFLSLPLSSSLARSLSLILARARALLSRALRHSAGIFGRRKR